MISSPCPSCSAATTRWLESTSKDAYVDYFRCDACGNVWNTPKKVFRGFNVQPIRMDDRCPKCGAGETDCLSDVSAILSDDYLRCAACGHTWTKPRAKGEPPCNDVEMRTA